MPRLVLAMSADGALVGSRLTEAISAAMVELYAQVYDHARTTATVAEV